MEEEKLDYRKEWHKHVKSTRYGKKKEPQMLHKEAMKKAMKEAMGLLCALTWQRKVQD